jgi:hypothetical protein
MQQHRAEIEDLKATILSSSPSPTVIHHHQQTFQVLQQPPSSQTIVGREEVLQSLDVDGYIIEEAFLQAKADKVGNSKDSSYAIQQILKRDAFLHWIQSKNSGLLVLKRSPWKRNVTSIFGFVAATLVETLTTTTQAAVLHFFCPPHHGNKHPVGSFFLFRSILQQLLSHGEPAIAPETLDISEYDLYHLQDLFSKYCTPCLLAKPSSFSYTRWTTTRVKVEMRRKSSFCCISCAN